MRKSYRGYALPSSKRVAYTLDYRCPRCCSENVAIDTSVPVPFFCDGSPSTADELGTAPTATTVQKDVSLLIDIFRMRRNKWLHLWEQKKSLKGISAQCSVT